MEKKKIILVTGATGAQGGSVAKALLADDKFAVRAFTRNPNSERAIALYNTGAEIFEGDINDRNSLQLAMKDCYGVYGVTNYWEHFEKEYEQGKNLIDTAKEMNIQHFMLHTLPDYNKLSNGKYPTPHCDIKAKLQQYTISKKLPATFMQVAFYYENFFTLFPLQYTGNDTWKFGFPQGTTKLAMISVEDVGGIVSTIFNHPAEYIGRTVCGVGSDESCYVYAALMGKILGRKIRYNYITRDEFAAMNFPGMEELANMFEVQRLYVPEKLMSLIESYGLNPGMLSFKHWLIKNKEKFDAYFNSVLSKHAASAASTNQPPL